MMRLGHLLWPNARDTVRVNLESHEPQLYYLPQRAMAVSKLPAEQELHGKVRDELIVDSEEKGT
jgi:hypothetical protein